MARIEVFRYEPPEPRLKEGVTPGWMVQWSGEPGPARALKMVALVDDEGHIYFEPNGEWEDITITAD